MITMFHACSPDPYYGKITKENCSIIAKTATRGSRVIVLQMDSSSPFLLICGSYVERDQL